MLRGKAKAFPFSKYGSQFLSKIASMKLLQTTEIIMEMSFFQNDENIFMS